MFLENMSWTACETVLLYSVKFLGHNKGSIDMEKCVLFRRGKLSYLRQRSIMMPQLLSNDSLKTSKSIKSSKSNMHVCHIFHWLRLLKLKRQEINIIDNEKDI